VATTLLRFRFVTSGLLGLLQVGCFFVDFCFYFGMLALLVVGYSFDIPLWSCIVPSFSLAVDHSFFFNSSADRPSFVLFEMV
jgi:hypothetical protein